MILHVPSLIAPGRDRSELIGVAEHDDLHTAEGLSPPPSRLPQRPIDGVHEVGVDHGDLIDDEGLDRVEDASGRIVLIDVAVPDEADREAEQEWIVCPSTFNAATPVGAQIAICFFVFQAKCCSSVDFPVPARPVMNTCSLVSSMSRNSSCCSSDRAGRDTVLTGLTGRTRGAPHATCPVRDGAADARRPPGRPPRLTGMERAGRARPGGRAWAPIWRSWASSASSCWPRSARAARRSTGSSTARRRSWSAISTCSPRGEPPMPSAFPVSLSTGRPSMTPGSTPPRPRRCCAAPPSVRSATSRSNPRPSGDGTAVTVSYRAGGHSGTTTFHVAQDGWAGVTPNWRFTTSPSPSSSSRCAEPTGSP